MLLLVIFNGVLSSFFKVVPGLSVAPQVCLALGLSLSLLYQKPTRARFIFYFLAIFLSTYFLVKIVSGISAVRDIFLACIWLTLSVGFLNHVNERGYIEKAIKITIYLSSGLALIGILQFFFDTPLDTLRPQPGSEFDGSMGFGSLSVTRPTFGLGNSINSALFFNIIIIMLLKGGITRKLDFVIFALLFAAQILCFSRFGITCLGLIIIMYQLKNFSITIIPVTLSGIFLLQDILLVSISRLVNRDLSAGSTNARIQIFNNFISQIEQSFIFGIIDPATKKITDGAILVLFGSIGPLLFILLSLTLFISLIWQYRLITNFDFLILTFVVFFSLFVNNAVFAYYNIFVFTMLLTAVINGARRTA
ncbi:hypothetical protein N8973_00595 [bacterium]|nr:hypothetical protein [bacterium]